jgi:hypothetical protein
MAAKKKPKGRAARSRRGKGESMTGAKEGKVEVRTASLIPEIELSDKDINHHFNAIKRATDIKNSGVSSLREAMKKAEQTHPGLGAEIAAQIKRENKPDETEVGKKLSLQAKVMKARGSSIQLNIFDTTAGDQMNLVYRRFFQDGKGGKALDNPYPAGSDLARQAARAWRHGVAANMNVTPEQSDEALEDDEKEGLVNLPPVPDMSAEPAHMH